MEQITRNQADADSAVSRDYAYITRQPGIRGGNPIVAGTRVGVHDVVGLLQNGETVDSIVSLSFPNLTRAQVYECLAYYEDHRGEIDLLVARQMHPFWTGQARKEFATISTLPSA